MRRIFPLSLMLTCLLVSTALLPSQAEAAVPYQWLAKQYTEGLGRGPDAGGWAGYETWFTSNACNQANLKAQGRGLLTSPEFETRGYNNAQRVFVAYRAILSREPDQTGFDNALTCLNSGSCTWSQTIDNLYNSPEFAGLVSSICAGANYRDDMAGNRPLPIGGERSQATLQGQLDAGGTVCLNPQEVVYLTSMLSIPASASLVTCGAGGSTQTAKFGRLVRDAPFTGALVETRGTIDRVWVDGLRGRFGHEATGENLTVKQGTVMNSRIAEARGFSNLHAAEPCEGPPTVSQNLLTGYTSVHSGGQWIDGVSIACNGSYVADNQIVDATDVGIVIFSRGSGSGGDIIAERNTVVAAGRSAFAALVVCDAIDVFDASCTGSSARNNSLWTSGLQHFDIGISVGTYPWGAGTATGGHAEFNSTPTGLSIRVRNGIVVDGVFDTVVTGNGLATVGVATGNSCPLDGGVSADVTGGHATGSIQSSTDRAVHDCVGVGH